MANSRIPGHFDRQTHQLTDYCYMGSKFGNASQLTPGLCAVRLRRQTALLPGLVGLCIPPLLFLQQLPETLFLQFADFSVVGVFEFVDMRRQF